MPVGATSWESETPAGLVPAAKPYIREWEQQQRRRWAGKRTERVLPHFREWLKAYGEVMAPFLALILRQPISSKSHCLTKGHPLPPLTSAQAGWLLSWDPWPPWLWDVHISLCSSCAYFVTICVIIHPQCEKKETNPCWFSYPSWPPGNMLPLIPIVFPSLPPCHCRRCYTIYWNLNCFLKKLQWSPLRSIDEGKTNFGMKTQPAPRIFLVLPLIAASLYPVCRACPGLGKCPSSHLERRHHEQRKKKTCWEEHTPLPPTYTHSFFLCFYS